MSGERAVDLVFVFFGRRGFLTMSDYMSARDWFLRHMPDLWDRIRAGFASQQSLESLHSEALARLASGNTAGV